MKYLIKPLKLSFLLISLTTCASYADEGKFSFGAGVGSLYANSAGINFSYRLVDHLDVMAAYGAYNRATIGLQYHLTDNSDFFQPHLSAIYGMNGRLEVKDEGIHNTHEELFNGLSAGVGCRFGFGKNRRHGVNVDILYRITDGGLKDRKSEVETEDPFYGDVTGVGGVFDSFRAYYAIQLSVGYNFRF
jgi:hypothetical protein